LPEIPKDNKWKSVSEDEFDLAYALEEDVVDDVTGLSAWDSLGEGFENEAAQAGEY
jgi:hypothetical protein